VRRILLSIVLAIVMVFNLNVAVLAGPGGGYDGDPPIIGLRLPIQLPIQITCPEDCQGQDEDY